MCTHVSGFSIFRLKKWTTLYVHAHGVKKFIKVIDLVKIKPGLMDTIESASLKNKQNIGYSTA